MALMYDQRTGRWIDIPNYGGNLPAIPTPQPRVQQPSGAASAAQGTGGLGGVAGMFSNLRNRFGKGKSLFGDVNMPNLKGLASDIRGTKLYEGGPSLGGLATTGMGLYQGANAMKGLYENIQSDSDLSSLRTDILSEIDSNPMYDMYLDAGDEKLLRQVRNGTTTNNFSNAASGAIKGIPQALLSTVIGGLVGGAPGAIVNGLGSLGNSAISGYGQGNAKTQSQLQGLYDRLRQASQEYRTMKRPSGLGTAGLQSRYFNQLY